MKRLPVSYSLYLQTMASTIDRDRDIISAARNAEQALSKQVPSAALAVIRASHLHRPRDVLLVGSSLLSKSRLSPRAHWEVIADVCRAGSECGALNVARSLVQQISKRFPDSPRRITLAGILFEAQAMYDHAMRLYMGFIDKSPVSPSVYKRQVAVLKAQLKWSESIALTNYYLSIYSQDTQAWAELCALCLRAGRLSHALFAASELVMNDPRNHAYHTLLADIYFTTGGHDNLNAARVHYTASINLRRRANLRALCGVWLCSTLLLSNSNRTQVKQAESEENVFEHARDHARNAVDAIYASIPHPHSNFDLLQSLFEQKTLE